MLNHFESVVVRHDGLPIGDSTVRTIALFGGRYQGEAEAGLWASPLQTDGNKFPVGAAASRNVGGAWTLVSLKNGSRHWKWSLASSIGAPGKGSLHFASTC